MDENDTPQTVTGGLTFDDYISHHEAAELGHQKLRLDESWVELEQQ